MASKLCAGFLHLEVTAPGLWPYFGPDFRVKLSTYKVFTILGARVFVQLLLELLLIEFIPCHFIEHGRQFVANIDLPDHNPVLYRTKHPLRYLLNRWRLFYLSNIQYPNSSVRSH